MTNIYECEVGSCFSDPDNGTYLRLTSKDDFSDAYGFDVFELNDNDELVPARPSFSLLTKLETRRLHSIAKF